MSQSRKIVQEMYSESGEKYDLIRQGSTRGELLSNHDISLFSRILPEGLENKKILEVGSGTGRFTLPLLEAGQSILATDFNQSMLDTLRQKIEARGLSDDCDVRQEDIFHLSFEDNSFDFVFCMHVIPRFSEVDDQVQAIKELMRVVKPTGQLLFNFRNRESLYSFMNPSCVISYRQVKSILTAGGFEVDDVRGKHFLNGKLVDKLPSLFGQTISLVDRWCESLFVEKLWDVFLLSTKK